MKRFATIGDTGLPMAVPNFCWYTCPRNMKYVVVRTNFKFLLHARTPCRTLKLNSFSSFFISFSSKTFFENAKKSSLSLQYNQGI